LKRRSKLTLRFLRDFYIEFVSMTKSLLKKLILIMILTTMGVGLTGCLSRDPGDTSIPWSRPASWENQVPGFQ
jgi:hypothetical protein